MNKMGKVVDVFKRFKNTTDKIKQTYAYKLFSRIFSFICTVLLILLLVLGAMMFYFNMKAKSYSEQGLSYNPPFGLYTIISGSMQPQIKVYDVVVAVGVNDIDEIKVGDIITFISTWEINYGDTVTHRVVSISKTETGEYQLLTKGDANQSADGAYVTQENLIGKVTMRIPQLGRVQFFLATKMGWFIAVFIPAMAIVIADLIKIFKLYVLKNKIGNVKDTEEAAKTYFEGEILDNREVTDEKLNGTMKIDINGANASDLDIKLNSDNFIKIKDTNEEKRKITIQKPLNKGPLKARSVQKEEAEIKEVASEKINLSNFENTKEVNEGRKILNKRKKL